MDGRVAIYRAKNALIHHEMMRVTLMIAEVRWRKVGVFERHSNLELITIIDQFNEKGTIPVKYKGLLFCPGQLVWKTSGGIHGKNK